MKIAAWKTGQSVIDNINPGESPSDQVAQQAVKEFEQGERDFLAAVPPQRRSALQVEIAPVRHGVEVRARQRAHNLAVECVKQDTQEILQSLTVLALREPEAAEIYLAEGEALLQSHAQTGALTREQFAAQSQVFRRTLYTKLLRSQSAIDAVADLRRRREDPAAYVMNLPGLSEAFSAAEADPTSLPEAIAERLAAQEAMGLTPDEKNALTLAERRQVIAGLQQLAPEQRAAALQELQQAYGEQAGAVVADLAEAGFSVDEVLATDPSGGPEVSGQLARPAETEQGTVSLDGDLISEMAERLIAGARASASRGETQQQVGRGGARAG